jgi:hypothetical protein
MSDQGNMSGDPTMGSDAMGDDMSDDLDEVDPDDLEIGGQGGDSVTDAGAPPATTDDDGIPLENPSGG